MLTKDKSARDGRRNREGKVLFLDARDVGYMADRVLRAFTEEDKEKPAGTFHRWRTGPTAEEFDAAMKQAVKDGVTLDIGQPYEDVPGFCKSATLEEIAAHGHVLTPGRYVGAAEAEDDGEPFAEKMARLTAELSGQFAESATLEAKIRKNLEGVGYGV